MDIKLRLDANKIYHKEFTGTKPGYDSLQVDTFLDIVIKDYESFETYLKESTKEIESLQNKIDLLKSTLQEMQTENASLKNKPRISVYPHKTLLKTKAKLMILRQNCISLQPKEPDFNSFVTMRLTIIQKLAH